MKNINTWYWRLWQSFKNNNKIDPTAWISKEVSLNKNITIGAYCIIGANAEHKKRWGVNKGVVIGDKVIITGHTTIDGGIDEPTIIAHGCFIMKSCHIGHDAYIGYNSILAPHVVIGGHTHVQINCNLGMGVIVHQRKTIPYACMIGMNSTITKTSVLKPYNKYAGSPVKLLGINYHKTSTLTDEQIIKIQNNWKE